MDRLKDKIAVVTGSGSGMGEGIVRLFAEEGARVVVSGRDEEKGSAVAADIAAHGAQAIFIRADVSVEAECRALIDGTVGHYGRIDALVNNVGLSTRGTIEDTTVELWDKLFATMITNAIAVSAPIIMKIIPKIVEYQCGSRDITQSIEEYVTVRP